MPAQVGTRYFDPNRPPRDRPPLSAPEEAVCAGDFLSDASVGAQAAKAPAEMPIAIGKEIAATG